MNECSYPIIPFKHLHFIIMNALNNVKQLRQDNTKVWLVKKIFSNCDLNFYFFKEFFVRKSFLL